MIFCSVPKITDRRIKKIEEKQIIKEEINDLDVREKYFHKLMGIYEDAMIQVKDDLNGFKESLNDYYNYNVINNIECRIKSPESIVNKMKRKQYPLNYKSLIENVQDIAGIRVICQFKDDIQKVVEVIEESPNIDILEKRDYLNHPKKSGYTGYHIIAQTPVNVGETSANVRTEIQIRSMAMDFWSSAEHKIKYKCKNKLSASDSKKMVKYAKLINKIDEKIMKIHKKYGD